MFGLDALTGGGLGMMVPGANLLSIVSKGLEAIKDLIEQGNTKGADAVLGFLNDVLSQNAFQNAGGAAEPQPFTPPQQDQNGANTPLNLQLSFAPPSGEMVRQTPLGTTDGSAAGDRALSDSARPRVHGSEKNVEHALQTGTNDWTTVMWALQQDERVQFDADSQRFFTTLSDGSKLDLCSIDDAKTLIEQNGGYDRSNPTTAGMLGDYLRDKMDEGYRRPLTATITLAIMAAHPPSAANDGDANIDSLNTQIDDLKRKLADLEAARQVMASSANVTMTVAR